MNAERIATVRGTVLKNEPMSKHTSWRVGGPADTYFQPADLDDLAVYLKQLPATEPLTWVGLGSNLLVRDGGIRGTVIATSGLLNGLEQVDINSIRAEAGVACAKVARFCARLGLEGAEFLAGIPGTMGGALAMNAGAFGGETWNIVSAVETLDHSGLRHKRQPQEFELGYRTVRHDRDEWFVAAELNLTPGDAQASQEKIRAFLNKRNDSQPTQLPNAGSVFKNPPADYAARLIEASELKNHCIGGACVSEKHANFIVNTGSACAADIEALILHVAATVERKQGVKLEREVRVVGEKKP